MSKSEDTAKILQLQPAPAGMFAVYANPDGSLRKVRIISLALCEFEGNSYMEPQEFDAQYGIGHSCEECAHSLLGYYLEGEEPSLEVYAAQARELAKIAGKAAEETAITASKKALN